MGGGCQAGGVSRIGKGGGGARGFTLVELLVVLVIIAIVASIALPSFRGLGQGNLMAVAKRQLLDDLSLARATAVKNRAAVYVVFFPQISPSDGGATAVLSKFDTVFAKAAFTNLYVGQGRAYALFARSAVGSQPGEASPRYLSEWKTLPDGIVIAPHKFRLAGQNLPDERERAFPFAMFPTPHGSTQPGAQSGGGSLLLPYVAFNSLGQAVEDNPLGDPRQRDAVIPLAHGSVLVPRNADGTVSFSLPVEIEIIPKDNHTNHIIRVNWLTGRAMAEESPDVK